MIIILCIIAYIIGVIITFSMFYYTDLDPDLSDIMFFSFLSFIWPLLASVLIIILPFWGLAKLIDLIKERID